MGQSWNHFGIVLRYCLDILNNFGFSNEELEDVAKKDLLFVREDLVETDLEYLKRIEKTAKIAQKEKY